MRNPVFDVMKGIGILLVILGHMSGNINPVMHNFIFSFHMPLFFIIAGYFFKPKEIKKSIEKDFNRLIHPYLFTCALMIIYYLIHYIWNHDFNPFLNSLIAAFWGNGSTNHSSIIFADIPSTGAIWFLLALFWCKNIYNIISNSRYRYCLAIIISLFATVIDRYFINLPFTLLPGMSALVFFAAGNLAKQIDISKMWLVIGIPVWFYCIFYSKMSIVRCYYENYPLDIIGGIVGTYITYIMAKVICTHNITKELFSWLGKNSLAILCYHLLVMVIPFIGFINKICGINSSISYFALSFILPLVFAYVSSYIPFTKKIFG